MQDASQDVTQDASQDVTQDASKMLHKMQARCCTRCRLAKSSLAQLLTKYLAKHLAFGILSSLNGFLFCNISYSLPPSFPAAVLDMPEEIEESIFVAIKRVLLRVGCAEIYLRYYWYDPHRFFLGGKNGSKQERDRAKIHFSLFGGDEFRPTSLFQVHEFLHRECQCSHEGLWA